ncbi:acetamidase [Bacillus sp. JCM 19046]|nr:acetamidase [Bacillus sp. JCM 19045]GAF19325.1 acetamidase [Bacillus sp. JCM 19046]
MKTHSIFPSSHTLHNYFDRELNPIIEIQSGDSIVYQTLDSAWGAEKRTSLGAQRKRWTDVDQARMASFFGHALIGPIAIKDAKQGDLLEVQINEIVPGAWGWAAAGGFPSEWNRRLGIDQDKEVMLDFELDHAKMEGRSQFGNFKQKVRLAPFMGIMGMPPAEQGQHSTFVPRSSGGNIDCKELQVGSRLFLPIFVDNGLFSIGDGHAIQGDGEVSGPALECPMERVHVTLIVHKDKSYSFPRAITDKGLLTMAFHEDLDEAMWLALNAMIDWMMERYSMSRAEAAAWASLTVDLRVTQIVNGYKGVHAFLANDAIY